MFKLMPKYQSCLFTKGPKRLVIVSSWQTEALSDKTKGQTKVKIRLVKWQNV